MKPGSRDFLPISLRLGHLSAATAGPSPYARCAVQEGAGIVQIRCENENSRATKMSTRYEERGSFRTSHRDRAGSHEGGKSSGGSDELLGHDLEDVAAI